MSEGVKKGREREKERERERERKGGERERKKERVILKVFVLSKNIIEKFSAPCLQVAILLLMDQNVKH